MAIKYSLKYYNIIDQQFELTIDIPSYSGQPIDIRGVGQSPVTINTQLPDTGNPFEGHVSASSLAISVYNEGNIDAMELQLLDSIVAPVKLYRAGSLIWSGFLSPDGIQSDRSGVAYPMSLNAVDGISSLADIQFSHVNPRPVTVNEQQGAIRSPLNAIRGMINSNSMLYNPLPIRFSSSLRNLQYPNDDALAGRTGFDAHGDLAINFDVNCKEVLEGICKSLKCFFWQQDGYWHIINREDITAANGTITGWEIPAGTDAVTATPFTVDTNVAPQKMISDGGYTLIKKSVGEVKVTYDQYVLENIIPNGSMDSLVTGIIRYWASNNGQTTLSAHDPIDGSISTIEKQRYALEARNTTTDNDYITFEDESSQNLPIDANILYKNMEWGFHCMPKAGFNTGTDGFINWKTSPLQISMSYRIKRDNEVLEYYLNEYGYWSNGPGKANIIVTAFVYNPLNNWLSIGFDPTSSPNPNDVLKVTFVRGGNLQEVDIVFQSVMTLDQAGAYMASQVSNSEWQSGGKVFVIKGLTNGNNITAITTRTLDSYYWIGFDLGDSVRYNDIVSAKFQSKANQGRVLFPDPSSLENVNSGVIGVLKMGFRVKAGMNYVLDNVYMNINNNNDLYTLSDFTKNSKEEYSLKVSSTFSGFSYSSYGDGFSTLQLSALWTDRNGTARLTESYGRSIMNWRNKPMRIYEGEFQGSVGFDRTVDVDEVKYMPTRTSYDTGMNNTSVTLFQTNWNLADFSVTHTGTENDN